MILKLKIACILLTMVVAMPLWAEKIVLARDSQPQAVIVLPVKPHKKLQLAANDLQQYIKKICGVELKIVNSNKLVSGKAIYIGSNQLLPASERPNAQTPPDQYIIKVCNGNVFICGRTVTSSSWGVYSLLQDTFGIRWFAPTEDWEYVPKAAKTGNLTVDINDKKFTPSISPRLWAGHYYTPVLDEWCRRQRVKSNEIKVKGSFANNIYRVFPPQKYAKDHPEYYPLVNGERYIPAPNEVKWRPCESNPDVQLVLVEYIRDYFDKNPEADSFSLGLDDIFHVCYCKNCVAMDNQPDDIYKKRFSSRHYKFVNIIAREVAKTHPDRFIGTLIYSPTLQPPVDVAKMEPNTFGFITQNSAMWKNPAIRQKDMALTAEWAKRIPYLSRYEYIGLSCITPRYYPHLLDEAFRYDLKHNFQGMYQEVCTFLPLTAPMVWALSEMQWDASKNIDDLLNEYMQKVYLDAADEMTEFYNHLEKCWLTSPADEWIYNDLSAQARVMTVPQLHRSYALLDKASKKTNNALVKKRIQHTADSLRYGGLVIEEYNLADQASKIKAANEQDAVKVVDMAVKFSKIAAEREKFWAASMKADSIFGESLRGQSKRGNLVSNGQISTIEAIMADAAIDVLNDLQKKNPELFKAQIKRLQQTAPCAFKNTVIAATLPAGYKSANLLPNASFEKAKPNGEPLHWGAWGSVPDKFPIARKMGRNNSNAARVNYNVGAAFLHYRKVKPGERYYAEVWIKGEGGEGTRGKGTLQFRFKTKDGRWHPNREEEPRINSSFNGEWRRLRLYCEVPEGAATMQLSVGGYRIAENSYVLLDDALLQKIYSEDDLAARDKFRNAPAPAAAAKDEPAGKNLLHNANFEAASPDGNQAAHWYNSGAPSGGRFKVISNEGRDQSNAAMVYSTHGSFIQFIRVKPGEKYYASAYVRASNQAKVYLMIRYKTKKGKWIELKDKEYKVSADGTYAWQLLQGSVTVPPEAAQMHIMLGANFIQDGEFVLFDDAVVKKLEK